MTRISKNFTLEELTASATAKARGIRNQPGQTEVINLCGLVHNVLQPLRTAMGNEIKIGSGYRCPALNRAVGGVSNSQHLKGEAADLCIDGDLKKGKRWFEWIQTHCDFDQLIWEHNAKGTYWVHVSFRCDGLNRRQTINNLLKNNTYDRLLSLQRPRPSARRSAYRQRRRHHTRDILQVGLHRSSRCVCRLATCVHYAVLLGTRPTMI